VGYNSVDNTGLSSFV